MYFDFLVDVPEDTGKISLNRRKGTVYVEYTYDRVYIPEKRYNVPKRTTIGKLSEDDQHCLLYYFCRDINETTLKTAEYT